jgi:hypothetical protein
MVFYPGLADHSMAATAWMHGVIGSATQIDYIEGKRGLSDQNERVQSQKPALFDTFLSAHPRT